MKSLIVMTEIVKRKLASTQSHEHVLMDLNFWNSLVNDRLIEVEMLLVKVSSMYVCFHTILIANSST